MEKREEKRIEARGLACPKPVILTKKAMDSGKVGDEILIDVDNEIAAENLRKLAKSQEADYQVSKLEEKHWLVKIRLLKAAEGEGEIPADAMSCEVPSAKGAAEKKTVVVFSSDKMGEGEDALGEILIKSFLYTLTQAEKLPRTLLFYNKGAFLTCQDSPVLEDLKVLEKEGVQIYTCGTCLDYYKLKDKLAVGEVANMYVIAQQQLEADCIIKP
ncbi:MAG TPA: sulfurtransferase-like selenium metabolism protein YedF [Candidatus Blautia pullicola]|jgi:selenium metabolism protein YedF|uniref:Sulfurtransferase-like selenium metabolism protein YedF n=1 Tax=Candidatus Blautia pullicola TaxID=2838498 RepID=A0A9D2JSF1_9FIRM|nr:sulfurtransferase-like selenium metabolism protein YedF [Candidatus Blautia pullicola]